MAEFPLDPRFCAELSIDSVQPCMFVESRRKTLISPSFSLAKVGSNVDGLEPTGAVY
jgi:hypothetical protein